MTLRHRRGIAAGLALAAGLLAACGDSENSGLPEADDRTAATAESSATPTTEPTPTLATAYPEDGVDFVDLPEVAATHADGLAVFVAFERGNIRLYHEARMNDLVADNASTAVRDQFEASAADLRAHDTVFQGTTTIEIRGVNDTQPNQLQLAVCYDDTKTQQVKNGVGRPLRGDPRTAFNVIVSDLAGAWKVTAHRFQKGEKC